MAATTFQPIHQHDGFPSPMNSRPNSSLSYTTDSNSENEAQVKIPLRQDKFIRSNHKHSRDTSCSPTTVDKKFLLRRSSSAMRVRELRDVLTQMTEDADVKKSEKEVAVTGSQNARLLVASQQCLVSRLQDLKNELESMDNEVTRVRHDIVNSRRYFSAMTGIHCGPEWSTARQSDSAYTSPTSFISRSNEGSPYNSDNDYTSTTTLPSSTSSFQQRQHLKNRRGSKPDMPRTDSCSSFLSWKSEAEMATLFPDDASSPQMTPRPEQSY